MILPLTIVGSFCIAYLPQWGLNWFWIIPWRRSAGKHWTERARVLSSLKTFLETGKGLNIFCK